MTSAEEIGQLYAQALQALSECRHKLTAVKGSLPPGDMPLWLKAHQAELGFAPDTAARLMRGSLFRR